MKVSVHTATFMSQNDWQKYGSTEDMIAMLSKLGFDGIEAVVGPTGRGREHFSFKEYNKAARKKLKEFADSKGIEIVMLSPYSHFGDPDPVIREREVSNYKECLTLAYDLGVDKTRFELGVYSKEGRQEQVQRGLECLKECTAVAEDLGITLVLDNHARVPITENVNVIESLGSPDCLKMNVDCGNAHEAGDNYINAARKWGGSLIVHTHVKDSNKVGDRWIPSDVGGGETDIMGFVRALNDVGYDGFFSIEHFGLYPEKTLPKELEYLRKIE
jgi:sugar phosphate isomerase/epimerase